MITTPRALVALLLASPVMVHAAETRKPNIIYILADDLGYGDVQYLNPQRGKIQTPHLDKLASQGMVFTDAHSGSSVCTPTRYGIMTGRYAWRTHLQSSVLNGFSPPLIDAGRLTVPAMLKQNGYATACIGKWHLGMTWPRKMDGNADALKDGKTADDMDWTQPILNGPTARGFDDYFGISASLDMPPFVYIRNDRVTIVPTTEKKWGRSGPAAQDFEALDVLPTLTHEAIRWIHSRAVAAKAGQPFFLYLPLTSPHTPILPTKDWQGKSGVGPYGDFVMETDWAVGEVLAALDQAGVSNNTLVVFTSDNGCSPSAGTNQLEQQGHFASAQYRGYKSDIWEGGHRVPFLVRWPDKVKPATQNPQLICHTDLMATCAEILCVNLPVTAAEDSVSLLQSLLGNETAAPREAVVHHSINGNFSIRQGQWKLELCPGSGGWGKPNDAAAAQQSLPAIQLYNLASDVAETRNVHAEHPDVVARLTSLLEKWVDNGRSTPGPNQPNDTSIQLIKKVKPVQKQSPRP